MGPTVQYEAPAHNSGLGRGCAQNRNLGSILLLKTVQQEAMLGGRPCSVTLQKRGVFSTSCTNQKCSKLHFGIDPRDDDGLPMRNGQVARIAVALIGAKP